jgi:hypothetical protein
MNGLQVGQFLLMRGTKEQPATFVDVNLANAKIGQLELDGATIEGALAMRGLQVGRDLLMRGGFASIDLGGGARRSPATSISTAPLSRAR